MTSLMYTQNACRTNQLVTISFGVLSGVFSSTIKIFVPKIVEKDCINKMKPARLLKQCCGALQSGKNWRYKSKMRKKSVRKG